MVNTGCAISSDTAATAKICNISVTIPVSFDTGFLFLRNFSLSSHK